MKKNQNTVFIIDDDVHIRESLKWLLSSVNLQVKTFANAIAFLDFYTSDCRGCLITDIRMPLMSGLELLERLRDLQSTLPVIVISGHGDIPMAVRAIKAGATDFLTKPFNEQYLIDLINNLMRQPSALTT